MKGMNESEQEENVKGMSESKQEKNVKRNLKRVPKKKLAGDGSTRVLVLGVLSLIVPIIGVFLGLFAIGLGIMFEFKPGGKMPVKVMVGIWLGAISFVITLLGLVFFVPMLLL